LFHTVFSLILFFGFAIIRSSYDICFDLMEALAHNAFVFLSCCADIRQTSTVSACSLIFAFFVGILVPTTSPTATPTEIPTDSPTPGFDGGGNDDEG
jgi:hypothetical protein